MGDSYFWSGLMKVKDRLLDLSVFNIHNGSQTRFWENKWLGNFTIKEQYPPLYNITRKKHISVANAFNSTSLNISFRRALVGEKLLKWNELVAKIIFVQLDDQHDSVKRSLTR